MSLKINIVTLGCYKNLVDSENLLGKLHAGGLEVVHDAPADQYEAVIINTCGFIGDAKEESVNTILSWVDEKKKGLVNKVYVMGCLTERYKETLLQEIPEADGMYGLAELPSLLKSLAPQLTFDHVTPRLLTTPKHYAYLKIAEGCNHTCSYCAIPLIRGKYVSRAIEEIVLEAEQLASKGVKEIILIAQDLTYYGLDLYKTQRIADLVHQLTAVDGIEWIRLQYAYPQNFPQDLFVAMQHPKVCKYLDISFQHISDRVLKDMRRNFTKQKSYAFIKQIREQVPGVVLRTSIIVGFPGETAAEFKELKQFIQDIQFDRLGVFTYSEEDGTTAALLKDNVSAATKIKRQEELMQLQQQISLQLNVKRIGSVVNVLIDRQEGDYYIGRTEYDSPEVDNEVLIKSTQLEIGKFYTVKIIDAEEFDLYGELIQS